MPSSAPKRPLAKSGTAPGRSCASLMSAATASPARPRRFFGTLTSTAAAITGTSTSAIPRDLSAWTSATFRRAAAFMSWHVPTWCPRHAPASAMSLTRTGRTSIRRRPTAFTPCRAASIRRRAASSSSSCSRNGCAGPWDRRRSRAWARAPGWRASSGSSGSSLMPS